MATDPQRPEGRNGLSLLDAAIRTVTLSTEVSSVIPARVVFGSASVLLATIRVYFLLHSGTASLRFMFIQDTAVKKQDYVDLGLTCADVCKALDRGLHGRQGDELSQSVREAIEHLTT